MEYQNNLILSAHRKSWQLSSLHGTEAEKQNSKLWEQVLKRDNYTCYYCNFVSQRWQEVHHLNEDHTDNAMGNLVTVCPLCHQNHHLNGVSTTNGGKIIWLPELSQQELNYLCRSIFIAMETNTNDESDESKMPFQKMALSIYQAFEGRTIIVDQHFHVGGSDPGIFGQVLLNMGSEQPNKKNDAMKNFKLLHSPSRFPVQIKYWKNTLFHDIPIETWDQLANNLNK